jgi:putative DNA-invertase from lambdoid prophage Rac
MVFTVLGAVAELERSLIAERVQAGLRNARGNGKCLGRPRAVIDRARIASLRAQGRSRREIAAEIGIPRPVFIKPLRVHQDSALQTRRIS